ncbi:unnamed protein product, partial [marine sediment metagenome]
MSNQARMPDIASVSTVMVNSYVYNWRWTAAAIAERYSIDMEMSLVGNVFDRGPSNQGGTLPIWCQGRAGDPYYSECWPSTKIYKDDNSCPDDVSCWQDDGNADVVGTAVEATWPTGLTAMASSAVWAYLEDNVGAWPTARDSVDTRLIGEVGAGTGSIKTSVPSFPAIPENTHSLTIPANPHVVQGSGYTNLVQGSGYTNLEEWLHDAATYAEEGIPLWPVVAYYVDGSSGAISSCGTSSSTYDIATRLCGSGTDRMYSTLAGAEAVATTGGDMVYIRAA